MTASVTLSILIVSWNVRDRVLACIAAIERDPTRPDLELILVDNASTDGTVEAVRTRYPWVNVIASPHNVGFPRANNQALAVASGRFVLYLNPDTEVAPGTLKACVDVLKNDSEVGLVGCRLVHSDGTTQYEGARNTYRFRHLLFELLYLHMLFPRSRVFGNHLMGDWDHMGTRDVEALCGAFMMAPRELAVSTGGLPEDVFMYHEDLSFCLRIRRGGKKLRYLGGVTTVHHCGQSSSKSSARFGILETESKYRYIREADGRGWAAAARGVLGLRSMLRLGVCAIGVALPRRIKKRYPRVFDWHTHMLQLMWCVAREPTLRRAPGAENWLTGGSGPTPQGTA